MRASGVFIFKSQGPHIKVYIHGHFWYDTCQHCQHVVSWQWPFGVELRDGVAVGGGDVRFICVYRGLSRTGSRMRALGQNEDPG